MGRETPQCAGWENHFFDGHGIGLLLGAIISKQKKNE
jgi:hypothetical protein